MPLEKMESTLDLETRLNYTPYLEELSSKTDLPNEQCNHIARFLHDLAMDLLRNHRLSEAYETVSLAIPFIKKVQPPLHVSFHAIWDELTRSLLAHGELQKAKELLPHCEEVAKAMDIPSKSLKTPLLEACVQICLNKEDLSQAMDYAKGLPCSVAIGITPLQENLGKAILKKLLVENKSTVGNFISINEPFLAKVIDWAQHIENSTMKSRYLHFFQVSLTRKFIETKKTIFLALCLTIFDYVLGDVNDRDARDDLLLNSAQKCFAHYRNLQVKDPLFFDSDMTILAQILEDQEINKLAGDFLQEVVESIALDNELREHHLGTYLENCDRLFQITNLQDLKPETILQIAKIFEEEYRALIRSEQGFQGIEGGGKERFENQMKILTELREKFAIAVSTLPQPKTLSHPTVDEVD